MFNCLHSALLPKHKPSFTEAQKSGEPSARLSTSSNE